MGKKAFIAFDKFKDCMSAEEANEIVQSVLINNGYSCDCFPLSDGGEGFVDTYSQILNLPVQRLKVTGPLKKQVEAKYLIDKISNQAYLELAQTSGIQHLNKDERDLLHTSTKGMGELINFICDKYQIHDFILGLGSSSTNDLGLGMLEELGLEINAQNNSEVTLNDFHKIKSFTLKNLKKLKFTIACDVKNPLLGEFGSLKIFGPQKGLVKEQYTSLESIIKEVVQKLLSIRIYKKFNANDEGMGAAGGVAFGLSQFFEVNLVPGIDLWCKAIDFESKLKDLDLFITGEGYFDSSSLNGKGPFSLYDKARQSGTSAYILSGGVCDEAAYGLANIYAITPKDYSLEQALLEGKKLLKESASVKITF